MGEYNGSKYFCSNGNDFSWNTAKNLSAAAGGHLVTINDAGENEFVRNLIGADDAWIGYSDYQSEGNFTWANGENPGYENWKCWSWDNCEPSGGDENFTRMLKSDGKWTDRDAWYRAEFVMEVPCPGSSNPGNVTVTRTNGLPSGSSFTVGTHTITYQATDDCGNTETCSFTVTVSPGQPATPGSIGNFVWNDTNGNGIQDAGEPGIPGVFVMLTDCAGNWKGQTTTGTNGEYSFTNVAPGSYKVKFVAPEGYNVAPTNAGSNDATDSDLLQGWTGFTECFDLASGQNRTDIDAGFIGAAPGGDLSLTCSNNISVTAVAGQSTAMVSWTLPTASSTCSGGATLTQTNGPANNAPMAIGTQTVSYGASDNCGNYETCSFTVTVTPGVPTTPASVGNFVWSDTNGNGIQDAGEPGIPGVFVMLTDCAGNWKGQTTTGTNGEYSFTNVAPGSYKVKFVAPADYTVAPTNAGSNDANDSDLLQGWTGFTECFDLASGQARTDIDAGFVPQGGGGGGCDNFTDGGAIAGVQTICAGESAAMITNAGLPTGGSGGIEYLWMAKAGTTCPNNAATYAIAGATGTSYSPGVLTETTTYRRCARRVGCTEWTGESNCITVTVDQSPNCGGGGTTPGTVGNFVWSDTNGNGIQDAGEPGISGVFIMLTDCTGNWKGQTTSGANGEYSFTNVAPGSYKVKFVAPADYTVAPTNAGSNDANDSDLLQGWTGFTECFDLASGQSRTDIDAGFVPQGGGGGGGGGTTPGTVGNFVWSDTNGNGIQDAGEPGIPGVFIMLTDCTGNWKGQTTSGANGEYSFTNVTPGSYKVKFITPADYTVAPTNAGSNDANDSDLLQGWTGFTECFDLASGESRTDIDAGFVPQGGGGGGGGTTPGTVGNFVWNDLNGNGIQDAGEPGVADVFIMLTDCAGNWKGQTTSGANGEYSFTNVAPGSYKVKFVTPAGYTVAPTNAGSNDDNDSDLLQGWTGFTECFDLASGQSRTDIDAGFVGSTPPGGDLNLTCTSNVVVMAASGQNMAMVSWTAPTATSTCAGGATLNQTSGPTNGSMMAVGTQTVTYTATDACGNTETCSFTVTVNPGQPATPGSVGNFVWSDTNGNGIQDAGEPGIQGVFVMLTDCAGNWKGQTTTDANGAYSFNNVMPGSYKVKFIAPADHTVSPTSVGTNGAVDSDVNQGWTGFTDCFDVTSGQNITDIDAGFVPQLPAGSLTFNCNNNMSVDATDATGTTVTWSAPSASSTCTGGGVSVNQTSGPTSGSFLATGTHTVTYTATDGCGNTETCSFTITVSYSGPTTCATREVWSAYQCNEDLAYGFYARNLIDQFQPLPECEHYQEIQYSEFVEYTDGTAHLTMMVRNYEDTNIRFQVELDFSGRTFTTPSDAHDVSSNCYTADDSDWYYYTNVTGTITGKGAMNGAVLNVWNTMHPFQMGTGAALYGDWNDYGGTTWLGYNVVSQPYNNYSLSNGGSLDINIHMSGNSTACGGSSDAASSTIMELALTQNEYTADLTWQNNTSDVNEYFIVERSTDGVTYTAIAQVESVKSENRTVSSYNFTDAEPAKGENYYQIVAVTNNNNIISNKTMAVFGERADITLFPNPAAEFFMIDLLPYKGLEAVITISDQLGRTVKTIVLDEVSAAPEKVSLDAFNNGYYNVQIQAIDGRTATKKLVVSRNY